ncbi:MAG: Rab family GTPase [Xenococcaceae cyanobacterium]
MSVISQKICLLGDFSVGKTSLVRRFIEGEFSDIYQSTVGVKISRKMMTLSNASERQIQLLVWDIEGQTRFKAIAPDYLRGAKGAIIVADLNRPSTIDSIFNHVNLFNQVNPNGLSIIALNKSDLSPPERLTKIKRVYQFDSNPQILATHVTSAKSGNSVNDIFQQLTDRIVLGNRE